MTINFKTIYQDKKTKARVGELTTPHGMIETPVFVPVGTQATVKSLTPEDLKSIGVQILFGNTYHLHLRPGEDVVDSFGGLGKFMHWDGVTMTDSGGFQVFSLGRELSRIKNDRREKEILKQVQDDRFRTSRKDNLVENEDQRANLVKISEDGVVFKSHLDGSLHTFTPEESIRIQKKLGADITLAFDQCSTYPISHETAKADMERTHRWAIRSLEEFRRGKDKGGSVKKEQGLYGIIQGSIFEDLRKQSAKFIISQDFNGLAIGGVANGGDSKEEMLMVVDWCVPLLPDDKVRHLLGVGDVDDIFEIVERGIDTFDCVTPSRLGRVGHVFVHLPEGDLKNRFRYDITKSSFTLSKEPIDKNCDCYVCKNYSRGYIQHLFRAKELLAYRLATYHNIYFITNLTKQIRQSLLDGRFEKMKKEWLGS